MLSAQGTPSSSDEAVVLAASSSSQSVFEFGEFDCVDFGGDEGQEVHIDETIAAGLTRIVATPKAANGNTKSPKTPAANAACLMLEVTPKKVDAASICASKYAVFENTPRASNPNRDAQYPVGVANRHGLSTPSWDIDKAFSFRKRGETKEESRTTKPYWGTWDLFGGSLSRSMSMKESSFNDDSLEPLPESLENEFFAMDVGLMFSEDDGDTINDPSALYSQATTSYSLNTLETYSCDVFIKNGLLQDDTDNATKGNEVLYPENCYTVRDDHGNVIPENAKMILGYDEVQRRKEAWVQRNQINQVFPTVDAPDAPPEDMDRRIRELAGQISVDWRGSDLMAPTLARRLRDFQFARDKRRKKYGTAEPWGVLGLYEHLSRVKIDVEWAEDAAWRRTNKQPYLSWSDFEVMKTCEGYNRPFFTFFIVSTCTAMIFLSIYANDWRFEPLSVNPMIGPSAETLVRLGAKDSYLIVMQQDVWRLFSPMVLHAGLIHYVLNMLALWFIGSAIEQVHGFYTTAVIFTVSAVGGIILSAIFLPEYITVGASGGIFGFIGACLSDITMNWNLFFNDFVNERGARLSHARVLIMLFLDIVVNCLIGLTPFIDNFTHLGGMIYGFLCGLSTIKLVSPRFFGGSCHKCKRVLYRSFGVLVCVACLIASSVVLFSGDGVTNPCPSCTKISCVTMPPWADSESKWWYCDNCDVATANGTLDSATEKFVELNITCPDKSFQVLNTPHDSWSNANQAELEEMLPTLCRQHCIW